MCGIAGMSLAQSDLGRLDVCDLSAALLRQIEKRGTDATGVAWSDPEGVWLDKAPVRGRVYAERHLPMDPRAFTAILHTRYATGGLRARPEINENNHPFSLPGVTGIHNGVLTNHRDIFRRLGVKPTTGTDSEAIFAALAHRTGTRLQALTMIRGDASVAWIETAKPDRLFLARLEGRPLAVAHTPGGSLLFASTKALLQQAADEALVPIQGLRDVPENTYLVIDSGRLIRMDRIPAAPRPQPTGGKKVTKILPALDPRDNVNPALRLGDLAGTGTVTADPRPGKSKWVPQADRDRAARQQGQKRSERKPRTPKVPKGTPTPLTAEERAEREPYWAWAKRDATKGGS